MNRVHINQKSRLLLPISFLTGILKRELLQEIADLNAKMDDLKENHVDEVRLLRKEVKLWQGLIRGWMSNHFKYQQHLEQADEPCARPRPEPPTGDIAPQPQA